MELGAGSVTSGVPTTLRNSVHRGQACKCGILYAMLPRVPTMCVVSVCRLRLKRTLGVGVLNAGRGPNRLINVGT